MGTARARADHCIGLPSSHFPPLSHLRLAHWGALPSRGRSNQAERGPGGHTQGHQEAVGASVCDTWPHALRAQPSRSLQHARSPGQHRAPTCDRVGVCRVLLHVHHTAVQGGLQLLQLRGGRSYPEESLQKDRGSGQPCGSKARGNTSKDRKSTHSLAPNSPRRIFPAPFPTR